MQIWKHMCTSVPAHNQAGWRYSDFWNCGENLAEYCCFSFDAKSCVATANNPPTQANNRTGRLRCQILPLCTRPEWQEASFCNTVLNTHLIRPIYASCWHKFEIKTKHHIWHVPQELNSCGTCQTAVGAASFGAAEAVTPAARQQTCVYLCFRKDLWPPAVFMRRVY